MMAMGILRARANASMLCGEPGWGRSLYPVAAEIYPRALPGVGSDDWVSHDEECGPACLAAMLHMDQSIGRDDAAHGSHLLGEAGGTAALPRVGQCDGIDQHGHDMSGFMGGLCGGKLESPSGLWFIIVCRLAQHSDAPKAGRVN